MNLPLDFIARTKPLLKEEWDKFAASLNEETPVSIRYNKIKTAQIDEPDFSSVPWADSGYYLSQRPQFTFDPLFHAGCYYVQEASSMFVGHALKKYLKGDVKVLDLCAAPGGKSTLIADTISSQSLLVANEIIRSRANILAENIAKWGNPNTVVTNNNSFEIGKLRGFFDVILVDAPCSGEGMFRKDENAISEWSEDNVMHCQVRQREILADIWPALKPGGLLLYSTCTYNTEENEANVEWLRSELYAEILTVETKEEWGITPSLIDGVTAYRFFPHKTKGEGFFFSLLRKPEFELTGMKKAKSGKNKQAKQGLPPVYKNYILDKEQFIFYQKRDNWYAFPSVQYEDLLTISSILNVVSEGICLGQFKGKDFIPDQSLALTNSLNTESFSSCEIDWATAIAFLRKEALVLADYPKGYLLLTYRDIPLGFVKNIGNRANNLYPQEWRIRSSNLPEREVRVI